MIMLSLPGFMFSFEEEVKASTICTRVSLVRESISSTNSWLAKIVAVKLGSSAHDSSSLFPWLLSQLEGESLDFLSELELCADCEFKVNLVFVDAHGWLEMPVGSRREHVEGFRWYENLSKLNCESDMFSTFHRSILLFQCLIFSDASWTWVFFVPLEPPNRQRKLPSSDEDIWELA